MGTSQASAAGRIRDQTGLTLWERDGRMNLLRALLLFLDRSNIGLKALR
jgi:hypothetical protein